MNENQAAANRLQNLKRIDIEKNSLWLIIVAIAIFVIVSIANPDVFLSFTNIKSMGSQLAEFGFFAVAMMISFLSGGIDISIVGTANLTGVTLGFMFAVIKTNGYEDQTGIFIVLAFLIAIGMGAAMGLFNGFLIARFKISPMLVTLGTMNLFMGIAIILTKAKTIVGFPVAVSEFGNGSIGILSVPLILFIVLVIITAVILNKTRFGFELRFFGTNPKATQYSGIKNNSVILKTYMYAAMVSAVAGAIMVMRVNSARANFGTSYMFTSILCIILGGISPMGGKGKISGVLMALICLQFLSSGFNTMGVSTVLKDFIWGALLLVVMSLNYFSDKRMITRRA